MLKKMTDAALESRLKSYNPTPGKEITKEFSHNWPKNPADIGFKYGGNSENLTDQALMTRIKMTEIKKDKWEKRDVDAPWYKKGFSWLSNSGR